MNLGFDQAKEKIRRALVYEYLKKHPGVREQDVILACRNGELIFTEISTVLADAELRKQSSHIFKQANSLFSELAIHRDERWLDCVESVKHCIQMIECLHSSLLSSFSNEERIQEERFVKSPERLCCRITVDIHEVIKELKLTRKMGFEHVSPKVRRLVLSYLQYVIDQLQVLFTVLNREIELGDIFVHKTESLLNLHWEKIQKKAIAFRVTDLVNLMKALRGDNRATLETSIELNQAILVTTKRSLEHAVDDLKKNLTQRRRQIQEIWVSISSLQETVKQVEDSLQTKPVGDSVSPEISPSPVKRMVRFLNRFHLFK